MEKWRVIEDFPDYEVSSYGRVCSLKSNRILRPRSSGWGYLQVVVYKDKRTWTLSIHRLVAEAFLGFHEELEVNHLDGNKQNNNLHNLEWSTKSQNNQHAMDTGLRKARATAVRIVETGEEFRTVRECANSIDGFASGVSAVLNGRSPHYKGLRFEYATKTLPSSRNSGK